MGQTGITSNGQKNKSVSIKSNAIKKSYSKNKYNRNRRDRMSTVNGKAMFAHVFKPDTKYTPAFTIDVIIDKATYDRLGKEATGGLFEDDGEYKAKFKTSAAWPDGSAKDHPDVFCPDGKTPFTQEIGNGSEVNVAYSLFPYTGFGGGVKLILEAVQVVEHVPYVKDSDETVDFADCGGADGSAPADAKNPFE